MPAARSGTAWSAKGLFVVLEFSMIHADHRRAALEKWLSIELRAQFGGERFSLTPASADASFRRYFRATLEGGRSYIAMDAPPEKEDCRPFVRVAGLLQQAGAPAPRVPAQDPAQGFLLRSGMGSPTYLRRLDAAKAAGLFRG